MRPDELNAHAAFAVLLALLWLGAWLLHVTLWLPLILTLVAGLLVMLRIIYLSVRQD